MAVSILRVRRTDKANQHFLVQVSHVSSKPLDLKLVGTEHSHLYHAEIKQSDIKSLQANSFSGDLDEWKATLKYVLLRKKPDAQNLDSGLLHGLETVAALNDNKLTMTIRKSIGGITQRLGEIRLEQDDEREEVDAFEWVDAAVATADDMRIQLETLQTSMNEQRQQVEQLTKQLDDLVKSKKEHEDELLSKFAALLNAKKLKIRDQQRLLAGAQVDPSAAEEVSEARSGTGKSRASGRSRDAKRKAETVDELEEDDVNGDQDEDENELRLDETPPRSDDGVTDDEDNLDAHARTISHTSQTTYSNMDIDEPEELPPRRDLPFGRKDTKPPEPTKNGNDDDDDDETDDEL